MSWYRKIKADSAMLAQLIATWLDQAARGPVDMHLVHQDIDKTMGMTADTFQMNEAASQGEMMYRANSHNNGELTPAQVDLLNTVRLRTMSPTSPEQPMGDFGNMEEETGQMENVDVSHI